MQRANLLEKRSAKESDNGLSCDQQQNHRIEKHERVRK